MGHVTRPFPGPQPMPHTCTLPGCGSAVLARFSPYCQRHRQAQRRHGHPLQTAIRATEVAPWLRLIAKRQAENPNNEAFAILRGRWDSMVGQALAYQSTADSGTSFVRIESLIAQQLVTVAGSADADTVVRTALALGMHLQDDPRRYISDTAVLYQMARRVLKLAPRSIGRSWDHKKQTSRTFQRDLPARVLERLGVRLNEAFGGAAAQLYAIEQARLPLEEVERRQLAAGLQSLKG